MKNTNQYIEEKVEELDDRFYKSLKDGGRYVFADNRGVALSDWLHQALTDCYTQGKADRDKEVEEWLNKRYKVNSKEEHMRRRDDSMKKGYDKALDDLLTFLKK